MKIYSILEAANDYFVLPERGNSFSDFMTSLFEKINTSISNFFVFLRNGVSGLNNLFQTLSDFDDKIHYLSTENAISLDGSNFLVLNRYIGNFRFATGDLVFTEIYVLLLVGAMFLIFQLLMKIFEALKYIFKSVTSLPIFNTFTGGLFGKLKNLF